MPVNYAELGGPDSQKPVYREGDEIVHPPGTLGLYKRIGGSWVCIRNTDGELMQRPNAKEQS